MTGLDELQKALDRLFFAMGFDVAVNSKSWKEVINFRELFSVFKAEQEAKQQQVSEFIKTQPQTGCWTEPRRGMRIYTSNSDFDNWLQKLKDLLEVSGESQK